MNIQKLLAKGRVEPITKTTEGGGLLLLGYRRKARSRKRRQEWTLKKPVVITQANPPAPAAPSPIPCDYMPNPQPSTAEA